MVPEDYLLLSSQLSVFLYVCLHMIMFLTVCLSETGQVHHAQGLSTTQMSVCLSVCLSEVRQVQVMVPTDDLLLR